MNKIIYIHNTNVNSSSANLTQVISMCNAFAAAGVDTTLLLPINKSLYKEEVSKELTSKFFVHKKIRLKFFLNPTNNYRVNKNINFLTLISILVKEKNSLIFVRSVHYLMIALLCGCKTVYESHNTRVHNGSKIYDRILQMVLLRAVRQDKFKLFVSISKNLNQYWMRKGIARKKSITLHDGFNSKKYLLLPDKQSARKKLNIPIDAWVIMYTGNIHKNRGINYIIQLAKNFPDGHFYIAGGPDSLIQEYFRKYQLEKVHNITFLGQVAHSDISDYQVAADILLAVWSKYVPTINYCSPLKIFEYMATMVPIVAFGYPSVVEVLKHNENALIAKPDSVNSLVKMICHLKAEPNDGLRLGQNARRKVYKNYSWEIRVKKIMELGT